MCVCKDEPLSGCASVVCVGCRDAVLGRVLKKIFETPYFRCVVVPDADTVEICGALKVVETFSQLIFAVLKAVER